MLVGTEYYGVMWWQSNWKGGNTIQREF